MIKFRANIKTGELILPMGIFLKKTGNFHRNVTISAMSGDDEESVSEKRIRNNGAKLITQLLSRKIVKIDDMDFPDGIGEDIVRNMFTDDRDACLVKMRELMKDEMDFTAKCPYCGQEHDEVVKMTSILHDMGFWGDESHGALHDESLPLGVVAFELPNGIILEDDDPMSQKELLCRKGKLKLTTGIVEEKIVLGSMNNVGKANTILLSECILELENVRKVDQYVIRALSRLDREYLTNLINDAKCGPEFRRNLICAECDSKFTFELQLPYFFTTGRKQK